MSPESVGWTSIETLPRTSFSRRALIWREVTYLPSRPPSGRGVDAEGHRQRRRVDVEARQRARVARLGDRVADRDLGQARHGDDLAGPGLGDVHALHAVRGLEARDRPGERDHPPGLDRARGVVGLLADDGDPLAHPDGPVADPADRHPADVLVRRQVGDQELQRVSRLEDGRRRDLDEQVEERAEVRARDGEVAGRRAQLGVRVDDRELDLVLVGAEVHEQLVDLVEDLGGAGVRAVDLVERHDDGQPAGHRLLEHVAGLRQRALRGVDQQQDAVDHQQASLDLAAEVGVAGRVDDVQPDAADVDRRLLGEDRDALLALEVAESIIRSTTAWFARNAPVWRSIASTSVVLPWSTWATIATLRRSSRTEAAGRVEGSVAMSVGMAEPGV